MSVISVLLTNCADNLDTVRSVASALDAPPFDHKSPGEKSTWTWKIDCKYYESKVTIAMGLDGNESQHTVHPNLQAIIVCFDAEKVESLAAVKRWQYLASSHDVPIRLMVCSTVPSTATIGEVCLTAESIRRQAISAGFELVELSPNMQDIEEDEEYGLTRIISALQAHIWPEAHFKAEPSSQIRRTVQSSTDVSPSISTSQSGICDWRPTAQSDVLTSRSHLTSADDDDIQLEDHEVVMGNLMEMRAKINQLEHSERHQLAAKLTARFWRAIGGSEDEIEGIEDEVDGDV